MCGICGFVNFKEDGLLEKMTTALQHRGPDESGYYSDDFVSLGNRRLSIIDLATGRQPVHNEDESIWVVFNGEIYNYVELREELVKKGHRFYTLSDTEVIVHAYEEYGFECVNHFNGEFAIALWDKKDRQLLLVRDRLGIRPLYYSYVNGGLIFASELKAILCCEKIERKLNITALDKYLTLRYVSGEESIMKGIYRLPCASSLIFPDKSGPKVHRYWELFFDERNLKTEGEYIEEFSQLLMDAVRLRLRSDVPVGAFLSGGVDSSTVVAMMKKAGASKIKTYSIGFGTDIDETGQAAQMADFLGTDHYSSVMDKQSYELLSKIVRQMDEPIGDAITIPTFLLSQEASRSVKVVLTGEGADEILAGYIHHLALNYGSLFKRYTPAFIRDLLWQPIIKGIPLRFLDRAFPYPASLGERGRQRLLEYLSCPDPGLESFFILTSLFNKDEKRELYSKDFYDDVTTKENWKGEGRPFFDSPLSLLNQVIDFDIHGWLPDYTLFKQDRLSMANSLEARVPFLDHRLVEFCARLPLKLKLNGFSSKYILRKTAMRHIPKRFAQAKKKAFYLPTEKCFGKDFDQFVRGLFGDSAMRKRGIFQASFIDRLLRLVRTDELVSNKQVMSLVILELWFREYLNNRA